MTPKEKALELYNKYRNISPPLEANIRSKKNALIAIEELTESTFSKSKSWDNWKIQPADYCTTEYWQEVKQQLEKL